MTIKTTWIFLISTFLVSFVWCIYRDIQIEKQFTGDLRNRVVGARLQKDGKLPYFYNWQPADGMRYYDGGNFDSAKVSNITATPFFHHLLYPIAELPQRTISRIWLAVEYLIMLVCAAIGFSFAKTNVQKWAILVTVILFLFTEAWKMHIANGQMYIVIPALCMGFYYFIYHKKNMLYAFLAGLCAVMLVLIRPNAIVFFLPFLLLIKDFPTRFLIVFILPVLLMVGLIAASKQERLFWADYKEQISEQIKLHQQLNPVLQKNYPNPHFTELEGWSTEQVMKDYKKFPYDVHSENGNVFVLVREILHRKVPVWLLSAMSFAAVILVVGFFTYYRTKNDGYTIVNIAILGFCVYMITDLFSPIFRGQYNTVQWLFPLLVAAAAVVKTDSWLFILPGLALVLNIVNTDAIKMEHSMGEYLLLFTLVLFTIKRKIHIPS